VKNELRIVGGHWRGRKLRFPSSEGLRPTPDRVRETLFNWLQQDLTGLSCLDLYSGSGALGFEAASRGAASVVAVERNREVCAELRRNCELLDARQVRVVQRDVMSFLRDPAHPYDVVFADPPFHQDLVIPCCCQLEEGGWLRANAFIYIEAEKELKLEGLPESWVAYRSRQAGVVGYHLFRRDAQRPKRAGDL